MAEKLERKETVTVEELAYSNSFEIAALVSVLERKGVHMLGGVRYDRIDDAGLHVIVDGAPRVIPADTIVVCAGQQSRTELLEPLRQRGVATFVIGGASRAGELDAVRAIDEGVRVAMSL